jgi:hypothetical protein
MNETISFEKTTKLRQLDVRPYLSRYALRVKGLRHATLVIYVDSSESTSDPNSLAKILPRVLLERELHEKGYENPDDETEPSRKTSLSGKRLFCNAGNPGHVFVFFFLIGLRALRGVLRQSR